MPRPLHASLGPDVFVIHSREDAAQCDLYKAVAEWAARVALWVVDYDDWQWDSNTAEPDFFGNMPTDPYRYLTFYNLGPIRAWLTRCEVVLIVESGTVLSDTPGIRVEIDELLALPPNPPAAIVIAASFTGTWSAKLQAKVAHRATEFIRIDGPNDVRVNFLIAVAWLVSRLQRSGAGGMEILTEATRRYPYLRRFWFFGPHWTAAMVDANASHPPVTAWWHHVADLDAFMKSEATGDCGNAWRTLTDVIAEIQPSPQ